MSRYVLVVSKFDPNPKYRPDDRFNAYGPQEPAEFSTEMLRVSLTEHEWTVVKKAVIEAIEVAPPVRSVEEVKS